MLQCTCICSTVSDHGLWWKVGCLPCLAVIAKMTSIIIMFLAKVIRKTVKTSGFPKKFCCVYISCQIQLSCYSWHATHFNNHCWKSNSHRLLILIEIHQSHFFPKKLTPWLLSHLYPACATHMRVIKLMLLPRLWSCLRSFLSTTKNLLCDSSITLVSSVHNTSSNWLLRASWRFEPKLVVLLYSHV